MSNIYVQEPPCEGKICLETTVGDIDIELWSKECPKACRNFVQLCLEGYYDKTKFFRVVPEFIVQGGDPTNTGQGGESVWSKPFKDEFHSRLRMVRRGLVAMANAGKDDNGSQFFFTLGPTKELQNKHTIFGKVVGDTIYNMIRLAEGHLEDGERPKFPHKILKTRVLINPFPDIEPRMKIEMEKDTGGKEKSKMKAIKKFSLLSFGEEAEDDEESLEKVVKSSRGKSKSAHDHAADPSLAGDIDPEILAKEEPEENEELEREITSIRDKLTKPKKDDKPKKEDKSKKDDKVKKPSSEDKEEEDAFDNWDENPFEKERQKKKEALIKEAKSLARELKGKDKKKVKEKEEEEEEDKLTEEEQKNDMLREYHEEQKKFKEATKLPKKKASREEQTLAMLQKFKSKLSGIVVDEDEAVEKSEENKQEEKSKENEEENDEDIVGDDWMKAPLTFESDGPVLAKDASSKDDDWFDIYDPRNAMNKRRREKDANDGREKSRKEKMMKL